MRELLYAAYLRFPRAFYDLHPTGQVVSRATNDLYPIRYFIGWGMVQGAQAAMMVVGAGVVLVLTNPALALLERAAAAADRARGVALRASRDADLARGPAAQGRRHGVGRRGGRRHRDGPGVRARGRRAGALRRPRPRAARRDPPPGAGRVAPPAQPLLPAVAVGGDRALPRRSRRDRRHAHVRPVRALHPAAAAARVAARVDGLDHQSRPSARWPPPGRSFAWLDQVPTLPEPDRRAAAAGRRGARCLAARRQLRLPGRRARAARRRSRGGARRGARRLRRDRRGQVDAARARPALLRPRRTAASRSAGATCATLALADVRAAIALVTQRPILFSETLRENLLGGPRRMRRGTTSSARARSRA